MKQRVYISPSASRKLGYPNPYFPRLKKELSQWFEVLEADDRPCLMQGGALLRNSFRADVFMLSFVETVAFQKMRFLQTCMALLAMDILRLRKGKLVFFFHNPHPHKGENIFSRMLTKRLFSRACLVVTHSGNTASIAREKVGDSRVLYFPHPTDSPMHAEASGERTDVLIWGTVLPYKGIAEFLESKPEGLKIHILGACPDAALASRIHAFENPFIRFDERRADMDEIASRVASSSFVLFPYLPGSISGSGVLMDTLRFGGSPVGPDVGAFHDLAESGLCRVYSTTEELMDVLHSDWKVDSARLDAYLKENSWSVFARRLATCLHCE